MKKTIIQIISSLGKIVQVDGFYAYITVGIIAAASILMYLMVRSSDEFTVKETEENSDDFAGVIKDSHGPITTWLWVAYIVLVIWAIAYLIQHISEFLNFY
ncbi:MAG: hypothetical protein P8X97_07420 [Candidatus Bathyarchaeota archaeon]